MKQLKEKDQQLRRVFQLELLEDEQKAEIIPWSGRNGGIPSMMRIVFNWQNNCFMESNSQSLWVDKFYSWLPSIAPDL